jgi:hypothetical protein
LSPLPPAGQVNERHTDWDWPSQAKPEGHEVEEHLATPPSGEEQPPTLHSAPAGQTCPQPPQLLGSAARVVQPLAQQVWVCIPASPRWQGLPAPAGVQTAGPHCPP